MRPEAFGYSPRKCCRNLSSQKRRRTWLLRIGGAVLMGILAFSVFYMWKSKKFRVVEVNTTIVDFGNVDTSNSDWDEFPNLLE